MVDYAQVSMKLEKLRPPKLVGKRPARGSRDDRHAQTKVAFFRYGYYDIAFKYFVEQVLDAEFVTLPPATRRTLELGSRHSNDFVCAPFKHILGDYLEALVWALTCSCSLPARAVWGITAKCRSRSCATLVTISAC